MRFKAKMLGLPASILVLLVSHCSAAQSGQDDQSPAQWAWNLPAQVRHWLETPPRRRNLEATEEYSQKGRSPVGVMKMSPDDGEKFYMEYWQFEGQTVQPNRLEVPLEERHEKDASLANISTPFRAPYALHTDQGSSYEDLKARKVLEGRNAVAALAILEKRDFVCPTGTASCAGIGYPNSCCSTSDNCFVITDTGYGPVGCCPSGTTCGGTISGCDYPNTACADNLGGGCCIPNYICAGVGCVINPTVVTTTITQILTVAVSSSSTQLTTVLTVATSTASTASTASTSSTSLSSSSSPSLLASSTMRTTTTFTSTSATLVATPTASGIAPVRPTSVTDSTTTATDTSCPTGFYACSAYYAGGCCRTGRNCDTTSCPVVNSTTIISSGVTVVAPVGSASTVTSPTGTCGTGWTTCAASVGGDCCPSGWECGTASCSSVGTTSTVVEQKVSPNEGSTSTMNGILGVILGAFCLGMIGL